MAHDIAALLKKYAEFYELLRVTESLPDPDPAVSMLRQGFAELYDALKVTWIPCEKRMPDTHRDVWVEPSPFSDEYSAPIASWCIDEWWVDDQPLRDPHITHWAEIRYPKPPASE